LAGGYRPQYPDLTHRVYAGQARYNYRQPGLPRYRKHTGAPRRTLKTGRHYRPESDWIWSDAPPLISPELFGKAQVQLQRNAAEARKLYQPSSHRYLLRTLVKCGDCGLAMNCSRQPSVGKRYEYLYYACKGHQPLNCGRATKCASRRVRADRLDALVWQALCQLLDTPSVIPSLHQTWVQAHQQDQVAVVAQQTQLLQRRQRLERQQQRLLDAYQAEVISLSELQARRQKLTTELQQLEQENQQLVQAQQRSFHWQQVTENAETFRHLLGNNLEQLAFEQRQAVAQCLIQKVVVTGDQVDLYYVLPFEYPPQVMPRQTEVPEGTPGHFYRLRLADVNHPPRPVIPHGGLGRPTVHRDNPRLLMPRFMPNPQVRRHPAGKQPDIGQVAFGDPAGQLARGRLTDAGIDRQVAFQPQAIRPAVLVQPGQ
jgi:site-specific DNA recombinase